jgi:hypothetical protein
MQNPIPCSGLFATRTLQEIQADIEGLPAKEKALVYSYVMVTLNACHVLTGEVIEEMTAYSDELLLGDDN